MEVSEKYRNTVAANEGYIIPVINLDEGMNEISQWYELTGEMTEAGYPIGRTVLDDDTITPLESELIGIEDLDAFIGCLAQAIMPAELGKNKSDKH